MLSITQQKLLDGSSQIVICHLSYVSLGCPVPANNYPAHTPPSHTPRPPSPAEIRRVQRSIEHVLLAGGGPNTLVFKGTDQPGIPATLAAVNHQHYGIARLLLHYGADVNAVDPRNGYTALRKVCGGGGRGAVQCLQMSVARTKLWKRMN